MSSSLRFHLDEHVDIDVAIGLRRRDRDCSTTPEQGLLGASDDDQMAFSIREGRVLVTADRDFLQIAAQRNDHAGIVIWRQQQHFGQLIRELDGLAFTVTAEEMQGRIVFLA